jgi:hypothetical protein
VHLGRLALLFGVLAIVGLLSALGERRTRAKLRELRQRSRR